MTDIPGANPGEWGKSEYEVQILVPNKNRGGERWRGLGEPHSDLGKATWAVEDLVSSMTEVVGITAATAWRSHRCRIMEKTTTCVYGKEMSTTL